MIITISGAACTGKTTLLNKIRELAKESNQDIKCYGEFIRLMFDDKYSDKYRDFADLLNGNPMDIINIHKDTAKYFNEVLWSNNLYDANIIFDRSPLDISIYLYMNLQGYLDNAVVMEEYRRASYYIYNASQNFMKYKPTMFYTRPFSSKIEDDGFRPMSLIHRRELELSLFDKEFLSLPGVHLMPSGLEDRLEYVQSVLSF